MAGGAVESTLPHESFWVSHRPAPGNTGAGQTAWVGAHTLVVHEQQTTNKQNSIFARILQIPKSHFSWKFLTWKKQGSLSRSLHHTSPSPSLPLAAWPRRHVTSGATGWDTSSFYRRNRGPERDSLPKESCTVRLQGPGVARWTWGPRGGGLSMRGHSPSIDWVRPGRGL